MPASQYYPTRVSKAPAHRLEYVNIGWAAATLPALQFTNLVSRLSSPRFYLTAMEKNRARLPGYS